MVRCEVQGAGLLWRFRPGLSIRAVSEKGFREKGSGFKGPTGQGWACSRWEGKFIATCTKRRTAPDHRWDAEVHVDLPNLAQLWRWSLVFSFRGRLLMFPSFR